MNTGCRKKLVCTGVLMVALGVTRGLLSTTHALISTQGRREGVRNGSSRLLHNLFELSLIMSSKKSLHGSVRMTAKALDGHLQSIASHDFLLHKSVYPIRGKDKKSREKVAGMVS
jgi:hypothetical protein